MFSPSRPRGQRESRIPSLSFAGGRQQFYWRLRCVRLDQNWAWRQHYLFGIPPPFRYEYDWVTVSRGCVVGARRNSLVEGDGTVRLRQGSDGLH